MVIRVLLVVAKINGDAVSIPVIVKNVCLFIFLYLFSTVLDKNEWQGGDVRFSDFFTSFAINVKSSEGDCEIKRMSDLLYFYINRYLAKCQPKTAAAKLNNFKMFWMKK